MGHMDLDGRIAWEVVALIALGIGVAMGLTGCGIKQQEINNTQYPMPELEDHEYRHTPEGTEAANQKLVDLVKDNAWAMGYDYHWYRQDVDGTWSYKRGAVPVTTGVTDPVQNAINLGYTTIIGYYYITEVCDID